MTQDTDPCDYAFPVAPGDVPYWQPGMTLRDWFAGQALAGIVQRGEAISRKQAWAAYDIADAMIKERGK